jgi:cytoskeletal protein CcmA (bactofilin family)
VTGTSLHAIGAAILALLTGPAAAGITLGDEVTARGTIPRDHYAAGAFVDLEAEVLGDLVAAGGQLDVTGRIAGDLIAAGGDVRVTGEIGDDARLAGGRVRLDGPVGDHVVAAGGSVTLGPGADVGRRAWLSGGTVTLAGRVRGPVRITAGDVVLDGRVDGPVEVSAGELRIGPGARIAGDLRYRAREAARIADGARIDGTTRFEPYGYMVDRPEHGRGDGFSLGGLLLFLASLTLAGGLLQAVFPAFCGVAIAELQARPLLALGVGALVTFAAPVALVLLALPIVTLPLSLAGLAVLPPLLFAGYLVFALLAAERGAALLAGAAMRAGWRRVLALALALLVIGLLQEIPYLGTLVLLAAVLLGTGAITLTLGRRYRTEPPSA